MFPPCFQAHILPFFFKKSNTNMSQVKHHIGSLDINKINLSHDFERASWAQFFNITESDLKDAVKYAGTDVKKVELYLYRNNKYFRNHQSTSTKIS